MHTLQIVFSHVSASSYNGPRFFQGNDLTSISVICQTDKRTVDWFSVLQAPAASQSDPLFFRMCHTTFVVGFFQRTVINIYVLTL